ncbi:MAG: response regulator [Firmicutes bacterium]|nr:response regulator [Bacillota bacterium]
MTSKKKILLVEDEPSLRQLVTISLKSKEMFELITAKNGREALELASKEKPDLVLLDVIMPQMSGYDVMRELKKNPETASIPVVFMSACFRSEDSDEGLKMGAVAHICKPFDPRKLGEEISKIFQKINLSS